MHRAVNTIKKTVYTEREPDLEFVALRAESSRGKRYQSIRVMVS